MPPPPSGKLTALLSCSLIWLLTASCDEELDCKDIRTGKFEIETEFFGTVYVDRTKTMSIELVPALEKRTENTITWTGPCSFVMEYASGDLPDSIGGSRPMVCKIIERGDGWHIVRTRFEGSEEFIDYRMAERGR